MQIIYEPQDLVLSLDKRRLQQVLLNLLTNAIKFTDSGSIIEIRHCIVESREAMPGARVVVSSSILTVEVEDNGVGMDQEQIENAFDLYYDHSTESHIRNPNSNPHKIGLFICKQICNQLGGDIYAH